MTKRLNRKTILNIEELDKKFDELLKDFDEEYINGWIRKKIEEEKEEQRKKRSEKLFCKCGAIKNTIYQCSRTDCDNTVFYFDAK